jgi:hypothetical protein
MFREIFPSIAKFGLGAIAVILLLVVFSATGINDSGYRTVIQYPSGETVVKFDAGWFVDWGGKTTTYSDVITYEFDEKAQHADDGSIVPGDTGVPVRYQDGGTGTVYGTVRVVLPHNEEAMMKIHKEFTSESGIMENLIEKVVRESLNLTAGLLTSEEAYAEKRNQYIEWAEDQISRGKYLTNQVERSLIVEQAEIAADGTIVKQAVTRLQNVPEIRMINGVPGRGEAQFAAYEMDVSGLQLIDWTFEPKTLQQISQKREANMAIITSQANAARANQERLQAIAEGEKNVATAKYEQEVEKERAVVVAEREKEVAEIRASQDVEVNRQNFLAQQQDVLAAEQEAIAIETRARANAEANRLLLESDGALAQKLATYERTSQMYANALAAHRLTPDLVMGGTGEGASGAAASVSLVDLLTAKTARDLALDLSVGSGTVRRPQVSQATTP